MSNVPLCQSEGCQHFADIFCDCSNYFGCSLHYGNHVLSNPNKNHNAKRINITFSETEVMQFQEEIRRALNSIPSKIQEILEEKTAKIDNYQKLIDLEVSMCEEKLTKLLKFTNELKSILLKLKKKESFSYYSENTTERSIAFYQSFSSQELFQHIFNSSPLIKDLKSFELLSDMLKKSILYSSALNEETINIILSNPSMLNSLKSLNLSTLANNIKLFYDSIDYSKAQAYEKTQLIGHEGPIYSIAISPNTNLIATASQDGTIKIWEDYREIYSITAHEGGVASVSFSPCGKYLGSSGVKNVKVWNVFTWDLKCELNDHTDTIWVVKFSGKYLVSASADATIIIWDVERAVNFMVLVGHTELIKSLAVSEDQKFVASGSYDGTLKIWNFFTGNCINDFSSLGFTVLSLAFSKEHLASGSNDGTVLLWKIGNWEIVKRVQSHLGMIYSLVFSPCQKFIAFGCPNSVICILRVATGEICNTLVGRNDKVWSVVFDSSGETLVSGGNNHVSTVWKFVLSN